VRSEDPEGACVVAVVVVAAMVVVVVDEAAWDDGGEDFRANTDVDASSVPDAGYPCNPDDRADVEVSGTTVIVRIDDVVVVGASGKAT
jgi:hypothetical protein